ncbi:hypothetical protein ACFXPA_32920 [Amycolatopsis sp. NPDC059090]|uniref:hypothetical protein n=1 Tax=unclassified Amycolatopsis TaxID=2618356 RepID=UPI00366C4F78
MAGPVIGPSEVLEQFAFGVLPSLVSLTGRKLEFTGHDGQRKAFDARPRDEFGFGPSQEVVGDGVGENQVYVPRSWYKGHRSHLQAAVGTRGPNGRSVDGSGTRHPLQVGGEPPHSRVCGLQGLEESHKEVTLGIVEIVVPAFVGDLPRYSSERGCHQHHGHQPPWLGISL